MDPDEYNLSVAGEKLPNIERLKLNNSKISMIRDLGTGWKNLRVLWLSRCGLEDVQGLSALPNIREMYLSFNDIVDITPIADLEFIEILDLESNRVEDIDSVEYLGMCRELTQLTLEGNPVHERPYYRSRVATQIPQLQTLDDLAVMREDRNFDQSMIKEATAAAGSSGGGDGGLENSAKNSNDSDCSATSSTKEIGLEEELKRLESMERSLISDGIKYTRMEPKEAPVCFYGEDALSLDDMFQNFNENLPVGSRNVNATRRPQSACGFRAEDMMFSGSMRRSVVRPRTAGIRPSTAGIRPSTAGGLGRPPIANHNSSKMNPRFGSHNNNSNNDCAAAGVEGSSDLTLGGDTSLAGNAALALLQRKAHVRADSMSDAETHSNNGESQSESSGSDGPSTVDPNDDMDMLEELKKWKLSNSHETDHDNPYDHDEHVTYQCLNLEDNNSATAAAMVQDNPPKPPPAAAAASVPVPVVSRPQIRQLKNIVIRDENIPVQPPGFPQTMHSSPKKPRAKTKANKQDGGIISSTTTTTTHGNISTESLEEQYQQYQETLQQQEREKTTVAVNMNMMHSHSVVVESFDTPVPPSRPTDAPSAEEGGPRRNGRGTFQRKMIVRRGLKVDRKALVAARVKRFTTERKGGEKQGLQKDKIQHGAENW
jgi:hypothetical protein